MRVRRLNRWDLTPRQAMAVQARLRSRVRLIPYKGTPRLVAGADMAFHPAGRAGRRVRQTAWGCVIVWRLEGRRLVEVERAFHKDVLRFPYVPGLLAFREAPVLLGAFKKIRQRPDVLFADAHGIAHPRSFGEACYLGLCLGLPTVGVAKSVLVGACAPPGRRAGSSSPLRHEGRVVGAALRLRDGVKPVYVSPGHRVDLASALRLTRLCGGGTRLPVPTREADRWSKELKKAGARDGARPAPSGGRSHSPSRRAT